MIVLEVRRLRLLVEVQRRGSIARAAETLALSPSGVSQQLALLEREVGAELLERIGRGVHLTHTGARLAARASEILDALEAVETDMRVLTGDTGGTVRVAAFHSAALKLVPSALDCRAFDHGPRVELVQVEPEDAVPGLLAGVFDLVVSETYPGVRQLAGARTHAETLCEDELHFVYHPRLAAGPTLTPRVGNTLPWVLEPQGCASRQWAERACRTIGIEPDVRYEATDLLIHLELIQGGHAVGVLPRLISGSAPAELVRQPTGHARTIETLVRRSQRDLPAMRTVRTALLGAVAAL